MYNVSEDYKSQIRKTLRNPSYMMINFSVVDPQAQNDSTITDNGEEYYSDSSQIKFEYEVTKVYPTLEHNYFLLDGKVDFPPTPAEYSGRYMGYISSEISGEDGYWVNQPYLQLDFTEPFQFAGLTFNFDTLRGTYPEELQVIAKLYGTEVYNQVKIMDGKLENAIWEDPIPSCDQIFIIGVKSYPAQRRLRISRLIFGIEARFTSEDIQKSTWKRSGDLINSKLPQENFNFTIYDLEKDFDPDNPEGLFKYLESQQPIEFSYGYELDELTEEGDPVIEWVKGGLLYSTGVVKVDTPSSINMVTFEATSLIDHLNKIFMNGVYNPLGTSLYDLAEEVLIYSELPPDPLGNPRWIIDPSLQTMYAIKPLPQEEVRVCLQLIANAARCIIFMDRDGYIHIEPPSVAQDSFKFDFDNIKEVPVLEKTPLLQGVDVLYTDIDTNAETRVASLNIPRNVSNRTYEIKYPASDEPRIEVTAGLTIIGTPTVYSTSCKVKVSGTGTISVMAKTILETESKISLEYNLRGDRCEIGNPLIFDDLEAEAFGTWIGEYLSRRTLYKIKDRGFPEIDLFDNVYLDTNFSLDVPVQVVGTKIDFNGSLSGETELLVQEEVV